MSHIQVIYGTVQSVIEFQFLLFLSIQVKEGMFDKERFDDLCWMMTSKKNFKVAQKGELLSERDSFKLFCLFNLLSEDRYPLVMIPEEVNDSEDCFSCDLFLQIRLITECASALRT